MAFDFSRMRVPTPEERRAREEADLQAQIDSDWKRREELSKHTLLVTLSECPTYRFTSGSDKIVSFHGADGQGRRVVGTYFVPYFRKLAEVEDLLASMDQGSTVMVRGYWKKRSWQNQRNETMSAWEFQIQFVEPWQG